jgi:ATP-dependent Clp protease ATP-binding subunit ClpC
MKELTPAAALAWQVAALEADGAGHEHVERAHLLIGILSLGKFRDAGAEELGLSLELLGAIRQEIGRVDYALLRVQGKAADLRRGLRDELALGHAPRGRSSVSRSADCKRAFTRAAEMARGDAPSALHLLAVLAGEPDGPTDLALRRCGVDGERLAAAALGAAGHELRPEERPTPPGRETPAASAPAVPKERPQASPASASGTPELDRYGRDLSARAARGELGPVIGRRDVLLEILRTLARSTKNNPLLVGEAGVGKTAVVEALAIRGAEGKDPAVLGGKRIVELNVGALLAGTQYRGEMEERVTKILGEVKAHSEVIVFIDELHTIVGAGRIGQGGMDAANLLKPALARGDFRCIGATTPEEFRRYVEEDAALERRFARIDVPEPSRDETLEILRGLRARWQRHHHVSIEDAALVAAVDLAVRFDADHHLPDKAVDLVDQAAARARVPMLSAFAPSPGAPVAAASAARPDATALVTASVVAEVLAEKKGLPLELVRSGGTTGARLLGLEPFLRERLIGQDDAVGRIGQRLRMAHAGLAERRGPLGVFLFLGPSGVGKTELARLLAEFLFGSRAEMTRLDMSELMEEHAVSKLLGAPPGYVGHDEEGQLTAALRRRPYSVVLLDEVEKAHPRVFDVFLQLFDEGRLTDSHGRTADGRHTIFVMTSNLGTAAPDAVVGFAQNVGAAVDLAAERAREEARRFFRPELLNRVDEMIVFRPLGRVELARIVRPMLESVQAAVRRQHGVELKISPAAEAFLVETGSSPAHGARELLRTVERLVQAPLSGLVLAGKLVRHPVWRLEYDEGGVYLLPG